MIAASAVIYPGVKLGKNVVVEDFCIIGAPFKGFKNEETVIGDNSVIRSHVVIYAGNRIGANFHAGHKANIRELNVIGSHVSIGTLSVVEHHVVIENNVRIHTQAFIPEHSILRAGAWIGPNAVLTNAKFPLSPGVKEQLAGVIVGEKAKIGANVTVLPGVRIGDNALIGAGSVLTKNAVAGMVYSGNPARSIRPIHY